MRAARLLCCEVGMWWWSCCSTGVWCGGISSAVLCCTVQRMLNGVWDGAALRQHKVGSCWAGWQARAVALGGLGLHVVALCTRQGAETRAARPRPCKACTWR
jgi:hypothetical protein